jgi:hypothetical protein
MKQRRSPVKLLKNLVASVVLAGAALAAPSAFAYPVDPHKVPVDLQQDPSATQFTLAYDDINANVVYYAPKLGRIATLNGQPLLGFAILPSTGEGYLNAQIEFGVFGSDKQRLLGAIAGAHKTAVPWPFRRTTVVPNTPSINPVTGQEICEDVPDPSTGGTIHDCEGQIFKQIVFSSKGPSLGENISISAQLKPVGAAIYSQMLASGNALEVGLDAEYYAAGTSFTATVTVSYDKLFENFRTYASFHGFLCTDIQVETFFQKETTCEGRAPSECGVFITYRDGRTGQVITTPTIDPDNADQQNKVFQAADRLAQTLRDQMLDPIQPALGPLDKSRPTGFKLDAKYERQHRGLNATFNFVSPNGVNVNQTHIDAALACVHIAPSGNVSRDFTGDCGGYWQ